MNGEPEPIGFVDTNILVYAAVWNDDARSQVARALLDRLSEANALRVSTQVLQEAFVVLTRKGKRPLSVAKALHYLDQIAVHPTISLTYGIIREAATLSSEHSFSFWDALVIVAASRCGAKALYSEDLQHGRTVLGVRIVNPFERS